MTNIGRYVERVAGCIMSPICEGLIFYEIARIQPDKLAPELDQYVMFLLANVAEKNIPYQAENFAKFAAKYKK